LGRSKLRSIMDIPAASPKSPCFDIRRRTVLAIRHGLVVMLHADLVDDKYDGSSHEETD
jgi:hypothetical protein